MELEQQKKQSQQIVVGPQDTKSRQIERFNTLHMDGQDPIKGTDDMQENLKIAPTTVVVQRAKPATPTEFQITIKS